MTARLARALGIETTILPATDDRRRTWIDTPAGSPSRSGSWRAATATEVDGVRFEAKPLRRLECSRRSRRLTQS